MLYVVEIRRGREELSTLMARVREWLDNHRFEPDTFRCEIGDTGLTCRIEFKVETEARACAEVFGGEVRQIGDKPPE